MKWAPVVPAFTQQRQQKAVSYFPHSTLEAVLHYVRRGAGERPDCACTVSHSIFTGPSVSCGGIEVTRFCDGKSLNVNTVSDITVASDVWVWRSSLWKHPGFRLLCPCVFVFGFLPGNFLPPPSAFLFVCLNPLLPLPSVPDCFAPQSSGVLVSSCCWPLSSDRLNRTDLTRSMTVEPLCCFLSAIKD